MRYTHISEPTLLTAVWINFMAAGKEELCKMIVDDFQVTTQRLGLETKAISHGEAKMIKAVSFYTMDYSALTSGLSTSLPMSRTETFMQKLWNKARLCDKSLNGNITPSIIERKNMISRNGA